MALSIWNDDRSGKLHLVDRAVVPLAQSMSSGATDWSGGVTTSTVRELPGYLFVWPTMDAGAAPAQRFYRLRATAP